MNFLVCISKTADTTSKIAFDAEGKRFSEEGVQFILNPYDEWYGLVRAIELRDQLGGKVDVIHVGGAASEILIRKALAIGADAAYRIDDEATNAWSVATQISEFAKGKNYDIIFTGKETIDYNNAEVGAMISEFLDIPFISLCMKLDVADQQANCSCESEGGYLNLAVELPVVISAAKGLAEQKIPNMKGIIDAKKKPLELIPAVPVSQKTELLQYEVPEGKKGVQMIDPANIDEMVALFKNELKII
ncbi:MAG: electron transfer flavoprotein subunit beta/FixA family protein [Saprospiraceae bacterium]|nr:electron transfer flavoprotein subunit beta/FixA family protein [Saprospiraceae bacterium]